jgi:hypothetical protein
MEILLGTHTDESTGGSGDDRPDISLTDVFEAVED